LLGLSQGGAVAIAYAARHPERVTHLVLCGAFTRGRLLYAKSQAERDEYDMAIKLAELGWERDNPAFRQTFAAQLLPDGSPEQQQSVTEIMRLSTSAQSAARILREVATLDVTAMARKIRCPTLVFHSRGDARIPFEEGRQLAALIEGARFVPLDGQNHILLENEPAWAVFTRELREFLGEGAIEALGEPFSLLSPRERDVLALIADGLDNHQIAARLKLSEKTVRNHITSIFAKLDVPNRAQAIVLARESGLTRSRIN
jgi:DNA-binding CsgD family transcriptional regulator/alpha-beta hydrolase superfamily lysophospholipase